MTPTTKSPTDPNGSEGRPADMGRVAELLRCWQERELALAKRYRECAGLTPEQVEDLYQDTALVLLGRAFQSEEHLRRALRHGLKFRALRVHRDERSHRRILARHAPGIQALARAKATEEAPEHVALSDEERSLIDEFLAELTPDEQRILWLTAEGVPAKRITRALGLPAPQAEKAKLSYERKRENYVVLYSTGRLCGLRSRVIVRLKAHQETSAQLAERAILHLRGCPHCRAEHQITAQRLRRLFEQQAAALLPIPALALHASWLHGALSRTGRLPHLRLRVPVRPSEMHARLAMILANTGPGTRVAAPLAAIAILATGGIGISHLLTRPATPRDHELISPSAATPAAPLSRMIPLRATASTPRRVGRGAGAHLPFGPGRIVPAPSSPRKGHALNQREPGGFAYLGVPAQPNSPARQQLERPGGGGPFSP
jgi:RNA polymerase sigma factor (sigma-70 family)